MQRVRLAGGTGLARWPSSKLDHEFSSARAFVHTLLEQQPGTWLWTTKPYWSNTDNAVDQARLFETQCGSLVARYLTGPAHIVILTFDDPGPPHEVFWWDYGHRRADCLERLPDVRLLRRFPDEGVKVLETRIPPDVRVILRPWRSAAHTD